MKNYIYLFFVLVFVSCKSDEQKILENNTTTSSSKIESTFPFSETGFRLLPIPIRIDTLFIQILDTNKRITYQQVRQLGVNFLTGELGEGLVYDFNEFAQIDSLKQAGAYNEYLKKLDIGMTKTCIAYKVSLINLPGNNKLFIWGITNESYEACPFFSGTLLIGTFVSENLQATHFNIAEISGGGDPPSMMNTQTTSKIKEDGTIEITTIVISDDMDVPGLGIEKTVFKLEVKGNAIAIVDTKKEILSRESVSSN